MCQYFLSRFCFWYAGYMHRYMRQFDDVVTARIQAWPDWLQVPMSVITFLGKPLTVIVILMTLAAWSYSQKLWRLLLAISFSIGVIGINNVLKESFRRVRPDTDYVRNMLIDSYSFPSGHSAAAAVGFGLLAWLMWQHLPQPWNIVAAVVLVVLIFLVGISRIYLGAHYPSDVIAGWLVGGIGVLLIIILVRPTL